MISGSIVIPGIDEFQAMRRGEHALPVGFLRDMVGDAVVHALAEELGISDPRERIELIWPVRKHTVRTLREYAEVVAAYRAFAEERRTSCYFRGQCRDYFTRRGMLSVVPASHRHPLGEEYYRLDSSKLKALVEAWRGVLDKELGISALGLGGMHWVRTAPVWILTNPYILALVMHYGFPTPGWTSRRTPTWCCGSP